LRALGRDDHAPFEAYCFQSMLEREQEHHDDYVVFYHSYSAVALLYEVQAEIARALYSLPDDFAPLPRIHRGPFDQVPELSMLRDSFSAMSGQDHDPKFRALAISVSNSLFASGSEAPPLTTFRLGYSCMDLSFRGLLTSLLKTCGMHNKTQIENLTTQLAELAERYGLPSAPFMPTQRGATGFMGLHPTARRGHMLQIFVHKDYADDICYRSAPYGVAFKDSFSLVDYLRGRHKGSQQYVVSLQRIHSTAQ
jgi:hypothetical protein